MRPPADYRLLWLVISTPRSFPPASYPLPPLPPLMSSDDVELLAGVSLQSDPRAMALLERVVGPQEFASLLSALLGAFALDPHPFSLFIPRIYSSRLPASTSGPLVSTLHLSCRPPPGIEARGTALFFTCTYGLSTLSEGRLLLPSPGVRVCRACPLLRPLQPPTYALCPCGVSHFGGLRSGRLGSFFLRRTPDDFGAAFRSPTPGIDATPS